MNQSLLAETFLSEWSELARLVLAYILIRFVFRFRMWSEGEKPAELKEVDDQFNPIDLGPSEKPEKIWTSIWFYVEALAFAGLGYLLLGRYGMDTLWILPVLLLGHLIIDGLRLMMQERLDEKYHVYVFVPELILHTVLLLCVWGSGMERSQEIMESGLAFASRPEVSMIALGYFLVWFPAGYFMRLVTIPWQKQLGSPKGLRNAGRWIGILERTLVITFILNNSVSAIGLLIAAKSVLRFGEIRDHENRKEAEYILIGTLLSFSIAIILGLWIKAVITGAHIPIDETIGVMESPTIVK
ncbi:MAG: hypothetical protein AAFY71_12830 [Bacteroidota bacterium]